eukprot:286209_1
MKKEYVFKNINYCNNNIVCLDEEFNDVIFDLPDGNKELMDKIKNMIKEGQDKKKDVKIVVTAVMKNEKEVNSVTDVKIVVTAVMKNEKEVNSVTDVKID